MKKALMLAVALAPMTLMGRCSIWAASSGEATITSDELEIQNNGAETFFRGHVVLKDQAYTLLADEMHRTKATGVVTAHGHIDGTWLSDKGEEIKAFGEEGRYNPHPPITELWGEHSRMIRWESPRDPAPVQVDADKFVANHEDHEFFALGRVIITQKPKVLTRSDKARYVQKTQTIHLYGPARVFVHVADKKGSGDFTAEKGWVTLAPKTAHMAGEVQGHVDPGQAL